MPLELLLDGQETIISLESARYRVMEYLGKGGQGEVNVVENVDTGEKAVLKRISLGKIPDWSAYQRYEDEAKALQRLDHEGIPTLYFSGIMKNLFYRNDELALVMEYVEGETLSERIQQKRRTSEEELRLIKDQALSLLQYAHAQGVYHRDIKPGNLKIKPDGKVALLDFGLAKFTDESTRASSAWKGTEGYMAPEQFTQEKITGAIDIYALGMTLIALALGEDPEFDLTFQKPTEYIGRLQQEKSLSPEFIAELETLVRRDPQRRPSPLEMLNADDEEKYKTVVQHAILEEKQLELIRLYSSLEREFKRTPRWDKLGLLLEESYQELKSREKAISEGAFYAGDLFLKEPGMFRAVRYLAIPAFFVGGAGSFATVTPEGNGELLAIAYFFLYGLVLGGTASALAAPSLGKKLHKKTEKHFLTLEENLATWKSSVSGLEEAVERRLAVCASKRQRKKLEKAKEHLRNCSTARENYQAQSRKLMDELASHYTQVEKLRELTKTAEATKELSEIDSSEVSKEDSLVSEVASR